jgi:hypothetical protein
MPDTTTAAEGFFAGAFGRPPIAGPRRGPPIAASVIVAGLLAGGLALLAPDPAAAPASAAGRAVVSNAPPCLKVVAPATPPARAGRPAPPGGPARLVAASDAAARSGRPALMAVPGSPPRSPCHPPPADPGFLVPAPAAPTPTPGRGARPPKVAEPDRRQPRPRTAGRPARKPRPTMSATAGPTPLPARAHGYAGGLFPADAPGLGGHRRSLIYSGLFGLALATVGMAMVGRQRRRW